MCFLGDRFGGPEERLRVFADFGVACFGGAFVGVRMEVVFLCGVVGGFFLEEEGSDTFRGKLGAGTGSEVFGSLALDLPFNPDGPTDAWSNFFKSNS